MDKLERSIDEMVAEYKEAGIDKMVLLGWDAETATGLPRLPGLQRIVPFVVDLVRR